MADSILDIGKKLITPFTKQNPNTPEYDPIYIEVMEKYERLAGETQRLLSTRLRDKFFYMGTMAEHWREPEGPNEEHKIFNYAKGIDDKYAQLLTAGEMPGLEWISPSDDPQFKTLASAAEAFSYRVARDCQFVQQLYYGALNGSVLGDTFFHVYVDPSDKRGSDKGTLKMVSISPFHIQVGFAKNDWTTIEHWIQTERITPKQAMVEWGVDIDEGEIESEAGSVGATANAPYDDTQVEGVKTHMPMVTVMKYHDKVKDVVIVHNEVTLVDQHNRGSHGLFHIRNRTLPNEPWGIPDHFMIKDQIRMYNQVGSAAMEIIDAHAAPIMVDYGNMMGGKKIKARHNLVITAQKREQGEGIEYLEWKAQTFPLEQYMNLLQDNIHNLAGMPKAAFGIYQPGSRSGFQLMIQMQPVLTDIKIKQETEWTPVIGEMFRYALKLALEFKLVKSSDIPKEVATWDVQVHWGSPLPRDDQKEVSVAIEKIQNKVQSRQTVMQELGVQDVNAEMERIRKEETDDALNSANAKAQAMQILAQAQGAMGGQPGQGAPMMDKVITHGESPIGQELLKERGELQPQGQKPGGESQVTTQVPSQGGENSVAPTSTM